MAKRTRSLIVALSLVLALSSAARAQSLNQQGILRLNQDVQALWTHDGTSLALGAAGAELQTLVGVPHQIDSKTTATIVGVNSLSINCPVAPGVLRLDGTGVDARLPLTGTWSVSASVEVHVKGKILLIPIDQTFSVTIALTDVSAEMSAAFDSSDPSAPKVTSVSPPKVSFNLQVTSTNFLANVLGWITSGLVDGVGQVVVAVAATYIAKDVTGLIASTPALMNTGGPGLAPIARGSLEDAATKLGNEAEQYRRPFGCILEMHFPQPYMGTWADSLNDPSFNQVPDTYHYMDDSCHFTGLYLAALAYEYGTTHDATTKARGKSVLDAMRTLATMRGEPGNLNRSIMPVTHLIPSEPATTAYTPGNDYAQMWNGQLYWFSDYMSRDQYIGYLCGLSNAYDLFDDPAMKASAQGSIEMALDYLLANTWTWRRHDGSYGEHWQGALDEQYAWVLAAWHGNPTKYQALHDQYKGFCDILWTTYWMAVIDPYDSYFKFNLGASAMTVLLQHETDPVAWMRAYQAVTILRHFIGHHLNARFNAMYLAFDPATRTALGVENTNLLTRWLLWVRRRIHEDIRGDATIPQMTFTVPLSNTSINPNGGGATTFQIAKYPLPPDKRIGSGYMWQLSPCEILSDFGPSDDPAIESDTTDYLLPYWATRYYGALVMPTRPPPVASQTGVAATTSAMSPTSATSAGPAATSAGSAQPSTMQGGTR